MKGKKGKKMGGKHMGMGNGKTKRGPHAQMHPHDEMSSHAMGGGMGDGMAHASHNAMNEEADLPHPFGGEDSYQDGGDNHHLGDNMCCE